MLLLRSKGDHKPTFFSFKILYTENTVSAQRRPSISFVKWTAARMFVGANLNRNTAITRAPGNILCTASMYTFRDKETTPSFCQLLFEPAFHTFVVHRLDALLATDLGKRLRFVPLESDLPFPVRYKWNWTFAISMAVMHLMPAYLPFPCLA